MPGWIGPVDGIPGAVGIRVDSSPAKGTEAVGLVKSLQNRLVSPMAVAQMNSATDGIEAFPIESNHSTAHYFSLMALTTQPLALTGTCGAQSQRSMPHPFALSTPPFLGLFRRSKNRSNGMEAAVIGQLSWADHPAQAGEIDADAGFSAWIGPSPACKKNRPADSRRPGGFEFTRGAYSSATASLSCCSRHISA
ncbi:Uncharacterised protein [Chromobacterium violaceum]|uniref:Uncharacterized protein n=1 Tax=Chromobacterium violaceum TaxID=536 RepID=A0A447TCH5_CHRVL|nr:Uncharacterised protein [Chromobacterium violaceum]